jgi:hypothetical protein
VRVVCANTWLSALQEEQEENKKNRGRGTLFSGKHTNHNLLNELGEWMGFVQDNSKKQTELVTNFFKKLVDTPVVHEKQAEDLIYASWPNPNPVPSFYPEALKEKKQKSIEVETEHAEQIRSGVYDLFTGSEGIGIDASYYGLFNSCSQYFNHGMKSKKDTSFSIAWGNRNNEMNHFAEVLRNDIENK